MDAASRYPSPQLAIEGIHDAAGRTRLTITGEIDVATVEQLRQAIVDSFDRPDLTGLDLDFGTLQFIDSSGVRELVAAMRTADKRQVQLTVSNAGGLVLRVLQMVGLDTVLVRRDEGKG
jgi:anti-sigma B factor antagonist